MEALKHVSASACISDSVFALLLTQTEINKSSRYALLSYSLTVEGNMSNDELRLARAVLLEMILLELKLEMHCSLNISQCSTFV